MANRAGSYKTNLSDELAYDSFCPAPLPPVPPLLLDGEAVALLINANKQFAVLNAVSTQIPSVNLFVSMYIRKEALLSSQIEGTQATLEDVLDPNIDANSNRNVADVVNYIKATEFAIEKLKELPLCNRLIKETHAVLMQGVRGGEKDSGEFRRSQNWIGGAGSNLKDARYIPPELSDMQTAISDLEKYINGNDGLDPLVRAALIHYQFETVHPFLDGNGRIGRLLITLFLMQNNVLSSPALYISYFLKKNRIEYYDRLSEVRRTGNFEQWVKFFLQAAAESAEDAIRCIDLLNDLRQKNIAKINGIKSSAVVLKLFSYIETNPIIEIGKTAAALNLSYNTVDAAIKKLTELDILSTAAKKRRNRTYSYTAYLKILSEGT